MRIETRTLPTVGIATPISASGALVSMTPISAEFTLFQAEAAPRKASLVSRANIVPLIRISCLTEIDTDVTAAATATSLPAVRTTVAAEAATTAISFWRDFVSVTAPAQMTTINLVTDFFATDVVDAAITDIVRTNRRLAESDTVDATVETVTSLPTARRIVTVDAAPAKMILGRDFTTVTVLAQVIAIDFLMARDIVTVDVATTAMSLMGDFVTVTVLAQVTVIGLPLVRSTVTAEAATNDTILAGDLTTVATDAQATATLRGIERVSVTLLAQVTSTVCCNFLAVI